MKIVLVSMAVIGSQLVTPVSDKVPKLNVEATCRAIVATDKEMGLSVTQSYDDCMHDENAAQDQLSPAWLATTNEVRHQCEGEATAAGNESYVDLLTCVQMADYAKSPSPSASLLTGASKSRNSK